MLIVQDKRSLVDQWPRAIRSPLSSISTQILTSDQAQFIFLGTVLRAFAPKHVEFRVTTAGGGAQTAEVGFFYSLLPPNKAATVFYKIIATGTVGSLTGTGIRRNTTAFSVTIPEGTHLWAGIRTAMATTQPTLRNLVNDHGVGYFQFVGTAGALTAAGPWTGALSAATDNGVDLWAVLD